MVKSPAEAEAGLWLIGPQGRTLADERNAAATDLAFAGQSGAAGALDEMLRPMNGIDPRAPLFLALDQKRRTPRIPSQ
jgi:hypothetical protein